jgi:hypothetical protein
MSQGSDEEGSGKEEGLCDELPRRLLRGLKEEKISLFCFERSFVKDEDGANWGSGPDETQRRSFAQFLADPSRFVHGSAADGSLRPRINCLQSEPLFQAIYAQVQHDAVEMGRSYTNAKYKSEDLEADLADPLTLEVFSEMAALFLFFVNAKAGRPQKRAISATVALLRETRAVILAMSTLEMATYRGRSLVSLYLDFADPIHFMTPQLIAPQHFAPFPDQTVHGEGSQLSQQNKRLREELESAKLKSQIDRFDRSKKKGTAPPGGTGKVRWRIKSTAALLTCTTCNGMGHLAGTCCVMGSAQLTCYLCRGKGHTIAGCPADKEAC